MDQECDTVIKYIVDDQLVVHDVSPRFRYLWDEMYGLSHIAYEPDTAPRSRILERRLRNPRHSLPDRYPL